MNRNLFMVKKIKSIKEYLDYLDRSSKNRDRSLLEGIPQVGIIYVINGDVLIDSSPYNDAEDCGDFTNHRLDHRAWWHGIVSVRPDLKKYDYAHFPRGRVVYNKVDKKFYLYLDKKIISDKSPSYFMIGLLLFW